jgi:predicted phage-related endonuclease
MLAVMVRSRSFPLHLFDVPRHPTAEQRILDAVAEFWRMWDAGEFPAAAPSAEIAEMLDDGSHKDLSSDNYLCTVLPEREAMKAEISIREKRIKEIDEALKAALGTASTAWVPGFNITFRSQHRKEVVIPAKDFRVLRVRANAEEEGADVQ